MVEFIKSDLEFILNQILISEAHAAGADLTSLVPNSFLSFGLRTVDGSFNNIFSGQSGFGQADQLFPRLTDPAFRDDQDGDTFDLNGGAPGGLITNTDYGQSGNVADADPRIISNLIVDQTLNNPAAIAAALAVAGSEDVSGDLEEILAAIEAIELAKEGAALGSAAALAQLQAAQAALSQAQADEAAAQAALAAAQGEFDAAQTAFASALAADNAADALVDQIIDTVPLDLDALTAAALAAEATQIALNNAQVTLDSETAELAAANAAFVAAQQATASATTAVQEAQALLDAAINGDAGVLAAEAALETLLDEKGVQLAADGESLFIPNVTPDEGLSAPFNLWFVFFGQFFDHGLDLVTKGGNGTVFIPLQPDDPLFNPDSPQTNFMVLTRATTFAGPGPDGIVGDDPTTLDVDESLDDTIEHQNTTTPFVDQNQTYTSHPSHQVFLRAYELDGDGRPIATGKLLTNRDLGGDGAFGTEDDIDLGGMSTWAIVKAQARDLLGIQLTDYDAVNVPLVKVDPYGKFIPGENGFPQIIVDLGADGIPQTDDDVLLEGDPSANGGLGVAIPVTAPRTGHMFLADIAHTANPFHSQTGQALLADSDDAVGLSEPGTYDDELLDAHFIAGDGRANENIGLTAVHHVFHAEHNRLVDHTKEVILASGDLAFLNQWLLSPLAALPSSQAEIDALQWNGERLFQAARFGTEMQYQHLVFEEFARKVQPMVDAFLAPEGFDTTIDPAIVAEFAHTVYRFGHSMLTETIDRLDPNFVSSEMGLIEAFLNPLAFDAGGTIDPEVAAGAIVRGTTRQVGNEIDEFVTDALRNNLLGLPLDLASINIARGRDTGIPSLNAARRDFYEMTSDSQLRPYMSWADFAQHLRHPESLVNFIAAYGTHAELLAADVDTLAEKRAVATALVLGGSAVINEGTPEERTFVADETDRLDFLNSAGLYASGPDGVTTTGLDDVDFWIGGLAEKQMPFGGLLGSTFNFVFETQLEALQNGDRFYYLARTAGLHFLTELENNSFAKLVMLHTDVSHLPADIFSTPTYVLEVDQTRQFNAGLGSADPEGGTALTPLVIRDNPATPGADTNYLQYTGPDHVVLGGTEGDDILISSIGDDTLWGDGGNDRLEGGYGVDNIEGGAGDDIITDMGGDDVLKGNDGHDVIHGGNGFNLILGGAGNDFIITGEDVSETFGGTGNDFILGAQMNLPTFGNEGDDWIEIGTSDGAGGDNFDPQEAGTIAGNDVFITGGGFDEVDGEGGDDILVGSDGEDHFGGGGGFDWMSYEHDKLGVTADLLVNDFVEPPATLSNHGILDRFAQVEGLSGSNFSDILRGDDADAAEIDVPGAQNSALTNIALISGLQELLGEGVTRFASGNIILGGDGSDIIEGRGGDDLIDGDRRLNVRVSVRDPNDHTVEIRSVESIAELVPDMLSGAINPSQLEIVREILPGSGAFNFDTALFSGASSEYNILVNDNGTPDDLSDDVIIVQDTVAGRDGTDTLKGIERLQFSDISITFSGFNFDPLGQLAILDAGTDAPDDTPAVGQLLRVSIDGVTDGDNVSLANPDGAITSRVTYVWQVERDPVNAPGVFEDIVNEGGGDPATQLGPTFRVTPDLDGLALRVKAFYQDANGVLETVFSAPTQPVAPGAPLPPPAPVPEETLVQSPGNGVHLIRSDLQFILDQIVIAERHADGENLLDLIPNSRLPFGLRTVDGSFNNLVPGQEQFGASDENFPLLLRQVFRNEGDDAFGPVTNNNYATSGPGAHVADADPRIISNLIVDQTPNNFAAALAAAGNGGAQLVMSPGLDGLFGTDDDTPVFAIPNIAPDEGLSAPFNAWFTFFGQFFDHGLDLVDKGGNGAVFIPLQEDDPLFVPGSPTNFMILTRAENVAVHAGEDGLFNTADDIHFHNNETTPFVDQNQTYTSHASHQAFLREYAAGPDGTVATGRLLEGAGGGLANWAEVKASAAQFLGILLSDQDVFDVPLLATDPYGNLILGPNGFAQVVTNQGLIEGVAGGLDLANLPNGAVVARTGHAFLNDIAHTAVPNAGLAPDDDAIAGGPPQPGTYDDELLDAHFITGDGRGNENIGLTAVHFVFHAEHNRLVDHIKDVVLASNDLTFISEWLAPGTAPATIPDTPEEIAALQWNGERLFQAARFGTEMQYQHLVFEEFARKVQPQVDVFLGEGQGYDTTIDPAIVAEFAHVVYRFGHSMLTETIDRLDPNFVSSEIGLIAAFLNPLEFSASGGTDAEAAGAIIRGVTRQVGNEIDEFVTEALRNNLLGLPLDLAAINIARGRDTGVPTLNQARAQFYEWTGDSQLKPYASWAEFGQHLKHEASLVNFVAAYGTHETITSESTTAGKRAAAYALVYGENGFDGIPGSGDEPTVPVPADRLAFLNGPAATTGVDAVDLWIGGLAEEQMPFGGLLGSTFNYVFENQLEKLQNGDRFYYLERTAGLNFLTELENNSFAKLIMANTDARHLPGDVFSTPTYILEVDQTKQFNAGLGSADPEGGTAITPLVIRDNPATPGADTNYLQYTGVDHVVLGGTAGDDILVSSIGDDTLYGDEGNDRLEGGDGVDMILGGAGDDIITDKGGDDNLQGGDGNDAIHGGNGINLILGGFGNDFIVTGEDSNESFGGHGNDFILGSTTNEMVFGNEGDDWIELGMADGSAGENFDVRNTDAVVGNDIFIGGSTIDRMNGEAGDDIMAGMGGQVDRYLGGSGFDWALFDHPSLGANVDLRLRAFDETPVPPSVASTLARFESTEGLSGSAFSDILRGDDLDAVQIAASGGPRGSTLTNFGLISGLQEFVGIGVTSFNAGNIILGGDGSDLIEGGGGDDLIDGDKYLNVRISVRENNDGTGAEIGSYESMTELVPLIFSGEINPGQLVAVREILTGTGPDFDTAAYSDVRANYTIFVNGIEQAGNAITINAGDVVTVRHNDPNADDGVGLGLGPDGTDRLTNIERLQFADLSIVLSPGLNGEPAGLVTIDDTTPDEDQLLTASIAGVTDPDNVSDQNPTGAITGPVSYVWQADLRGDGVFEDIVIPTGLGDVRATGSTFRPGDGEVGAVLRVKATYMDADGNIETVFSAPTAAVTNVNDVPVGTLAINDTTPTEGQTLTATNLITDADGLDAAVFAFQWQSSADGGTTWDDIEGANALSFVPGNAQVNQMLRIVATYTDDQGTAETVISAATAPVANIPGPPLALDLSNFLVSEDVAALAPIATVTVDDDPGESHAFVIDDPRFEIVGGVLRLVDGASLDDADVGLLSLLIDVTSDGDGLSAQFPIQLVVLNVNEAPTGVILTQIDVPENVPGAIIGELTPSDPDIGDVLAVSVANPNFEVVSIGGIRTLKLVDGVSLNFEATPQVTVAITVTDQAGLSNTFDVTFNVTDVDDAAPVITSGDGDTAAISIAENTTAVTDVNALDDSPLTFSIVGGADADRFTIEAATGILAFLVAPDFEAPTDANGDNVYEVVVQASDGSLTDTQTISVTVTNLAGIVINGTNAANTLGGTDEDDTLSGLGGNDTLTALAGNDTLFGGAGNDTLNGDTGNDTLSGDAGNDTLNGGVGNDTLLGGAGADNLNGGDGDDTLTGGLANDIVQGGAGNDTINYVFGDGVDTMNGGADNDTLNIFGTAANNVLDVIFNGSVLTSVEGGAVTSIEAINADLLGGVDTLSYNGTTASITVDLSLGTASGFASIAGIENVTAGSGNDTLIGNAAANVLRGGTGNDTYFANSNDTLIETGAGVDQVFTDSATFTLANNIENLTYTGAGNFTGTGNGLANVITGAGGNDTLNGGNGNDTLNGGGGTDTLNGGGGNDRLEGAAGNDTMNGGAGLDTFVFGAGFGNDTIIGFDANAANGQDLLDISALGITAANFAALVAISDLGNDTLVTIDGNSITLVGVSGVGANSVTISDFILA